MLKYKDFSLIKPHGDQCLRISDIINEYNGSIFHELELNNIVQENFNSELYYLVDKPDKINCFTPVHIIKDKYGVKRYNCNPIGDIPYAGFTGNCLIDITKFSVGPFESIKYAGFPYMNDVIHKINDNLSFGETTMVDLSLDEDEIFNNVIHSKRRNMIRKAIKSEISIERFYTEDGFKDFWPILEELHKKLGYSNYSYDYYNNILKNYGTKKRAYLLIAYKEERPISGVFIIGNKNYMHYYKGAGLFDIKNEGQGELLQWEAIKTSKSLGVKYYDLCNLDKDKLPSIYRFKTGISNNICRYPKFTMNKLGYKIMKRLNNA